MSKDNNSPDGRSFDGGRREGDRPSRRQSYNDKPKRSDSGDGKNANAPRKSYGDKASDKPFERRPYNNRGKDSGRTSYRDRNEGRPDSRSGERPAYGDRSASGGEDRPRRAYSSDEKSRSGRGPDLRKRNFEDRPKYDTSRDGFSRRGGEKRNVSDFTWKDRNDASEGRAGKPYGNRSESDRRSGGDRPWKDRNDASEGRARKPYGNRSESDRRSGGDRPWKDRNDSSEGGARKPYGNRSESDRRSGGDRPWKDRNDASEGGARKPYGNRSESDRRSGGDRPWKDRNDASEGRARKPYGNRSESDRRSGEDRPWKDRNDSSESRVHKPFADRSESSEARPWKDRNASSDSRARKPFTERSGSDRSRSDNRHGNDRAQSAGGYEQAATRRSREDRVWTVKQPYQEAEIITTAGPKAEREGKGPKIKPTKVTEDDGKSLRLNQYLAHCGIASRREADEIIKKGEVSINGETVTTLGVRVVNGTDDVRWRGLRVVPQSEVYVLLNKPKNTITTVDDPEGRKTVLDLVRGATKGQRIYPVGRLDRNTTGLLLLTNDGEMADKLMHPSHKVRKLYHAKLDRAISPEDLEKLLTGVELEDGMAHADKVSYVDGTQGTEVGIEIHIGRNRVVRRMFEALTYEVKYLDRVGFAHLTKKDLPRGRWRYLTEKEVNFLKMV